MGQWTFIYLMYITHNRDFNAKISYKAVSEIRLSRFYFNMFRCISLIRSYSWDICVWRSGGCPHRRGHRSMARAWWSRGSNWGSRPSCWAWCWSWWWYPSGSWDTPAGQGSDQARAFEPEIVSLQFTNIYIPNVFLKKRFGIASKAVPYLHNLDNGLDRMSTSSGVNKSSSWSILDGVFIGWRKVRTGDICFIFLVTSSLSPLPGHICVEVDLLTVFKCRVDEIQYSCSLRSLLFYW